MEEGQFQNQGPNEFHDEKKPIKISFSGQEAYEVVKTGASRPFRIHVIIGVVISLICLALWIFISFAQKTWPFFFYVMNFFILTTSAHYYLFIRPKEFLPLHIVWYCSVNLMITLTWFFTHEIFKAWFLYPLLAWGLLLTVHYIVLNYRGHHDLFIYIHFAIFVFVNALCFFIWMDCNCFRFFVLVLFSLGLPFAIHWCLHYYPGDRHKLHLYIYLDINLLLFFVWIETNMEVSFPWFVFPLVLWGIVLAIHYWKVPRYQPPVVPVTSIDEQNVTSVYATNQTQGSTYNSGTVPLEDDKHTLYPPVQNQGNQ